MTTASAGRSFHFPKAGTPPAETDRETSRDLVNDQCKSLIILMEATTRIELVYTVLQTVA